jgi:SAM-dependent methyltransferase
MPLIYRFVRITNKDVLVDVGCGKGRMINYWLSRKLGNRIFGLELDPRVAGYTARNLSKWRNVTIKSGDAIANLPKDGTVFYFYNPFTEEKVREFEAALSERFANKPITVIYYNPKSLKVFQNGKWRIRYIDFEKDLGLRRWGRINKYHDLAVITNQVGQ